jgi:general secretion pathway protein D
MTVSPLPPSFACLRPSRARSPCPRTAHASAPARHATARETYTIDFPSIEAEAAARAMATILDRPILVDPRVKGTVRLFSDTPVTRAQAFALFQSAMRGAGDAVVESEGLLKVVPEAEAKLQTGVVMVGGTAQARASRW